ncbi:MAG: class I SAM-dependent methyltransferase [Candidatus Aminicenantes bacterium]|nr:MAG: class I SAM-dependent methyltransferase [Candidatus Aminicenantes bacterium]
MKDVRRLYHDLSWIWPIVSPPEDYVEETESISRVIKEKARIDVRSLLHLGCGGGRNDFTFQKQFAVTGVDISEEMLKLAKELNPAAEYIKGDMRSIRLGRTFDCVVALDSVNYMKTEEELSQLFYTAFDHLNPGGVFLTVVEESQNRFKQNRVISSTHSLDDTQITFIENSYDPNPEDNHFEMTFIYLVRDKGGLKIYTDSHIWGLFKMDTWRRLLKTTGFDVQELKFEHSTFLEDEFLPMFVCSKPK